MRVYVEAEPCANMRERARAVLIGTRVKALKQFVGTQTVFGIHYVDVRVAPFCIADGAPDCCLDGRGREQERSARGVVARAFRNPVGEFDAQVKGVRGFGGASVGPGGPGSNSSLGVRNRQFMERVELAVK
ncbi:hypothetical protein HDU84_000653 [Entophlyctis sp. JEL0112]|nr:hypothetical protein HDU84_000653 [Entophlyctis sp. JEL0112]